VAGAPLHGPWSGRGGVHPGDGSRGALSRGTGTHGAGVAPGRHGRDLRAGGESQGDCPRGGRRPAGRHRRLSQLCLRPVLSAAMGGSVACRPRVVDCLPAVVGERLRLFASQCQDPGSLLPRVPFVLERRGLLLFRAGVGPWFNGLLVIVLSVMVFVPIRYLYPSRNAVLQGLTLTLGGIWGVLCLVVVYYLPDPPYGLAAASLFFPAYYLALSFWSHMRHGSGHGRV
ncbi:hypothetical protein GBAR_LOCUS20166, partial [Geodia barretti]